MIERVSFVFNTHCVKIYGNVPNKLGHSCSALLPRFLCTVFMICSEVLICVSNYNSYCYVLVTRHRVGIGNWIY
jgi:hypothetical protein